MCKINFNLEITTPNNDTNYIVTGRYRIFGSGNPWTTFTVSDVNNPSTPNITTLGNYELEVFVTLNSGAVSDAATSIFRVSSNCGRDDGEVDINTLEYTCKSITFTKIRGVNPNIDYIDCYGVTRNYNPLDPSLTFEGGNGDEVDNQFTIHCVGELISDNSSVSTQTITNPTPTSINCDTKIR